MGNEEESAKNTKPDSVTTPTPSTPEVKDTKEQPQEKKQEVEKLRTVIKVNTEETATKPEKKEEKSKEKAEVAAKTPPPDAAMPEDAKSELEQRRNILRSIKDFDFLIKKNQEDIGKLSEQVNGLTNDLDDLVSLYEIVSEQMNPFVGLSKVTKKRLDALENFTKEVEEVKTKIGDMESEMEKIRGAVKTGQMYQMAPKPPKPVAPPQNGEKTAAKPETTVPPTDKPASTPTTPPPTSPIPNTPPTTVPNTQTPNPLTQVVTPSTSEIKHPVNISPTITVEHEDETISDSELDVLFSKSLEALVYEEQIDSMINEFLLSLK